MPLDVTGLTFAEARAALGPAVRDERELRGEYRRLFTGASSAESRLAISLPELTQRIDGDDATKLAFSAGDGHRFESVVVSMQHSGRCWKSVCVSTQVGCRYGCRFCQTATLGWQRDLSAREMVAQVLYAQHEFGTAVRTVVFMGMGEPLDNLENVLQTLRVLNDRSGIALKMARITVSTVGRVDGIRTIARLGWKRLNLAVSLNAPNDALRRDLMPFAQEHSLLELRQALLEYPLRRNQHFMIQYVLIPGVNDAEEHARELSELLAPVRCLVNVIPHNPRARSAWRAPSAEEVDRFVGWMKAAGQPCRQRVTRGREQWAACGQLGNGVRDGEVVRLRE